MVWYGMVCMYDVVILCFVQAMLPIDTERLHSALQNQGPGSWCSWCTWCSWQDVGWGSQAVWPWLYILTGHRLSRYLNPQHHCVFVRQASCQASFRPLPGGLKLDHECPDRYIIVWVDRVAFRMLAAANRHTVLLRSDGCAVTCGDNGDTQNKVPLLEEEI